MSSQQSAQRRILMTADAVGGIWQYSVDLISKLVEQGCDVLLAVLGPSPSPDQLRQLPAILENRIVIREFALEWMPDPWQDLERSREWLLGLAHDFKPHIIHLNSYALADAQWGAPVVSVAHSCVVSWWHAVHECAPGDEWRQYEARVRRGITASSAVIAPSHVMAEAVMSHYGVSRGNIRVIANFSTASVPSCAKQPFILSAGRMWDQAKNLALLEQIADRLDWPLMIAGNELMADATGPIQLGRLTHSELLQRMAQAGIFAHPALYEPFGLAVLEAAKARCCLVLAGIPSLRELWDGAACFVNPRDLESWVREINRLIADEEERERLASAAYAHAARYRSEISVPLYLDVYDRVTRPLRSRNGAAA